MVMDCLGRREIKKIKNKNTLARYSTKTCFTALLGTLQLLPSDDVAPISLRRSEPGTRNLQHASFRPYFFWLYTCTSALDKKWFVLLTG